MNQIQKYVLPVWKARYMMSALPEEKNEVEYEWGGV